MSQLELMVPEVKRAAPEAFSPSGAVISPCGLYRYRLYRRWAHGAPMLFVMLNPSTADATEDDPTIRRCIGFAKREGMPAIEVVNLFAYRATDPADLAKAADPVGPENTRHILEAAIAAGRVVAAWGKSVPSRLRARPAQILALLSNRASVYAIGKAGEPPAARHPLYLRADAPLELLAGGGR